MTSCIDSSDKHANEVSHRTSEIISSQENTITPNTDARVTHRCLCYLHSLTSIRAAIQREVDNIRNGGDVFFIKEEIHLNSFIPPSNHSLYKISSDDKFFIFDILDDAAFDTINKVNCEGMMNSTVVFRFESSNIDEYLFFNEKDSIIVLRVNDICEPIRLTKTGFIRMRAFLYKQEKLKENR
jgi:hypothetical protein